MALIDRVREAWDDLRGTRKEEQETSSVGQSVADSPAQWARDYKAAVTPGESVEPVALDRGFAGNVATLALVSEPARVNRVENFLDHGSTENAPIVERQNDQIPYAPAQEAFKAAPESQAKSAPWENYEEQNLRVEHAAGKHYLEFTFEKETGDIYTYKHDATGNRIHLDSKGDFYDVHEGKEPTLTTRAEVLRAYQEPSPEMSATLTDDHRQKWVPLEKEVGFTGADSFHHYETRGDIQVYMTVADDSKRMIGLDDKGQFHSVDQNSTGLPVSRDEALYHVQMEPSFYTPAERSLREAVGNENTSDLLEYSKNGDIRSYEYLPTGGSLHLDSVGKFYNADRQIVSRHEALSTMQVAPGGGLQYIAPTPAQAPGGSPEYVGVPHTAVSEMPLNHGPVQPAAQEQSISM